MAPPKQKLVGREEGRHPVLAPPKQKVGRDLPLIPRSFARRVKVQKLWWLVTVLPSCSGAGQVLSVRTITSQPELWPCLARHLHRESREDAERKFARFTILSETGRERLNTPQFWDRDV